MAHSSVSAPSSKAVRLAWLLPAAVVLFGLGLRLYRLDHQSLWYDEVFALTVSHYAWPQMFSSLVADIVHPPLHYLVLHFWTGLFGVGPVQGRLVSVIFGTLSIALLYVFANYLFDRSTAALSAVLLAVSQLSISYSQEARAYAMFLFLVLVSSYLFLRSLRSQRPRDWWLFIASTLPVIYTHYYGAFVLAAFALFALLFRKRYPIPVSYWLGGSALIAGAFAVWLFSGVIQQELASSKVGVRVSSHEHWYTIVTIVNSFNNGRVDGFPAAAPVWTFLLGGIVFTLPALFGLRNLRRPISERQSIERENSIFLLILCGVSIVLALTAGATLGFYEIRYVVFCAAPYYVLVARGLQSISSSALRNALIVLGVAYSAYGLRANYVLPYKEDYRGSLDHVAELEKSGDCYVIGPPWVVREMGRAWAIYEPGQPALSPTPIDSVGSCDRVWLITQTSNDHPPAIQWRKQAQKQLEAGYSSIEKKPYFWMEDDLYERKPDVP